MVQGLQGEAEGKQNVESILHLLYVNNTLIFPEPAAWQLKYLIYILSV